MMVKVANDRDPFLARHEVNRDCVYVCVWKGAEVIAGHVSTE